LSKTHSKLSPSATSRWLNCPGSLRLSQGLVSEDSVYAIEGTKAHDLAEKALAAGAKACAIADDESEEMAAAVQVYLDEIAFVRATVRVLAEHTERKLECLTIDGLGGTADHVMLYVEDGKIILHCFDYKHGVGVPVAAEENLQVLSYFVILESNYPEMVDEFRGTIVQPRAFAGDGVQTWSCSPARVQEHAERIITETAKDHLAAGDWCRWCPALMICPEVQRHAAEVAEAEFSQVDIETLLHYEQISPAILAFLKKIPQTLLDTFRFGDGIPGKKVIERLGNRRWKLAHDRVRPELEKMGLAKEAIVEEKLRTPPQVEKLLDKDGKKVIASLVTRDVVGYKIVPVTAKGEPVDFHVSEFTEFTEDGEE
jgi:hypothetical protein